MNIKNFMIVIFVTNSASIHIIQTMHKGQSPEPTPFEQLQALQTRYSKPLRVSFKENEKGITYRVSGFQDDVQKFITFSNTNHVQGNELRELNKKELFDRLVKPFIVCNSRNKHYKSFNVSGLTKDEQYTDYLNLSRIKRPDESYAFSGTLTRIKKAFMYNNLNFELHNPKPYILDKDTAKRYWLSAEKALKKQREAKKNHSS